MKLSRPLGYIGKGLISIGIGTILASYRVSFLPAALPNPTPIEIRMQNLQARISLNNSKRLGYNSGEIKAMQSEIEEIKQRGDVIFYNEIRSEAKSDRGVLYLGGLALCVLGTGSLVGASFLTKKNR